MRERERDVLIRDIVLIRIKDYYYKLYTRNEGITKKECRPEKKRRISGPNISITFLKTHTLIILY